MLFGICGPCMAITVNIVTSPPMHINTPALSRHSNGVFHLTLNRVVSLYSAFAVFVWLSGNYRESRKSRITDQKSQEYHSVEFCSPRRNTESPVVVSPTAAKSWSLLLRCLRVGITEDWTEQNWAWRLHRFSQCSGQDGRAQTPVFRRLPSPLLC